MPTISAPATTLRWTVGDKINFAGGATDAQDGTVPAARLSWSLLLHHCPSACHTHQATAFEGVASGSFNAPDHEYPMYLELVLTATDAGGLSASRSLELQPATAQVVLQSNPAGLTLDLSDQSKVAPFTSTALAKSIVGLDAPSPQVLNGVSYSFSGWSDGGAAAHNITTPLTGSATYVATFKADPVAIGLHDGFDGDAVDGGVWGVSVSGSTVGVASQVLEIRHGAGSWSSGLVESLVPFDQTGRAVQVQVKRAAGDGAKAVSVGKTTVSLRLDGSHYASLVVVNGSLTARLNSGAGEVNLSPSWPVYSVSAMQWLRFRETAGVLYWEYAGGATAPGPWTVLASRPDPFAVTGLRLRLQAGSDLAAADTAQFDNVSTTYAAFPNDGFDGDAVDGGVWGVSVSGSTVGVASQVLEIRHGAGSWSSGLVESLVPFDQTGRAVQVQVKRAAGDGAKAVSVGKTTVSLRLDGSHYASLVVVNGSLTARLNSGAGEVNLSPSWPVYSVSAMQWLRFRETAGVLYWEYAGGATAPGPWTVLASRPDPFAVTGLRLRLQAGSDLAAADTAQFDNVSSVLFAA